MASTHRVGEAAGADSRLNFVWSRAAEATPGYP
jgi:hypothetical protein